jgi:hypothetical protein
MTMQDQIHPEDERLSALAGGDPEAAGDAALRAHVEGCQRCASLVRDLGELRVALAQLPDLPPSRPLQLIPPVPEPVATGAGGGWLRRLAAPAMAAGLVLAVIGGAGFGVVSLSGLGAAGAAPAYREDTAGDAADVPEALASAEPELDPNDRGSGRPLVQPGSLSHGPSARGSAAATPADSPVVERHGGGQGADEAGDQLAATGVDFNEPGPWLAILAAGVALLLLGLMMRAAISPRAG